MSKHTLRLFIFCIYCLTCMLIYKTEVHADELFFGGPIWPQYNGGNGYKDYNNFYNSLDSSGAYTYRFALNGANLYDITEIPNFVVMKFCTMTPVSSYWYSDRFSTMSVEMTDSSCHYFNSDVKGKTGFAIMSVNKPSVLNSNCNVSGTNCNYYNMAFNLSFNSDNYLRLMSLSAYSSVPEIQNNNAELNSNLYNFNLDYQEQSKKTQKKLEEANQNIYNFNLDYQKESNQTQEKIGETNKAIKDTNDTIKNDDTSEAQGEAESFFSGFDTDTFGLTSIITAPLNLIGSITSSKCTDLPLDVPFVGKTMKLPCMSAIYEEYFGTFLTIYQIITFGVIAYWVCVNTFRMVKDFKNPEHDEIEVLDL